MGVVFTGLLSRTTGVGIAYIVVLKKLQTFLMGAVPSNRAEVDQAISKLDKGAPIFQGMKCLTILIR